MKSRDENDGLQDVLHKITKASISGGRMMGVLETLTIPRFRSIEVKY